MRYIARDMVQHVKDTASEMTAHKTIDYLVKLDDDNQTPTTNTKSLPDTYSQQLRLSNLYFPCYGSYL